MSKDQTGVLLDKWKKNSEYNVIDEEWPHNLEGNKVEMRKQ